MKNTFLLILLFLLALSFSLETASKTHSKVHTKSKISAKTKGKSKTQTKTQTKTQAKIQTKAKLQNKHKSKENNNENQNFVSGVHQHVAVNASSPHHTHSNVPLGSYPWTGSAGTASFHDGGIHYSTKFHGDSHLKNVNKESDYPKRVSSISNCPCAADNKCICGEFGPITNECACAAAPQCPPCIVAKSMKQMHQLASEFALEDAETQGSLQKESILEKKLFEMAKKYAKEAQNEEDSARKSSIEVQQHSSKAQIARNKMMRAENQAKQIALDTVRTMTVHPPHEATGTPGMKIEPAGVSTNTIIQRTPYYNMHIGATDGKGFADPTSQVIYRDMMDSVGVGKPKEKAAEGEQPAEGGEGAEEQAPPAGGLDKTQILGLNESAKDNDMLMPENLDEAQLNTELGESKDEAENTEAEPAA